MLANRCGYLKQKVMKLQETKKVYDSILKIARKNKDLLNFDFKDLEFKVNNHLFGLELKEVYGLEIDDKIIYNIQYQELKNNVHLTYIDSERTNISWEDNGKKPQGERLIKFSYPTGAYIFGGDYPCEFFKKFFLELKSFNPDYIDSANSALYFKLENAKEVFNNYDAILKKYYELNKEDFKQREIIRKQKELADLMAK
jgi:hypothetical protein